MEDHNYLERRIAREVASRKEAERLLELKSEELYEKNKKLQRNTEQLSHAMDLLHSIMRATPEIIVSCDSHHIIEKITDAAQGILGYEQEKLIGSHISVIFPEFSPEDINSDSEAITLPSINTRRSDGKYFSADVSVTRLTVDEKLSIIFAIRSHDTQHVMDNLKNDVYWQLHETRRLESIGALASGLAHELNTPMQFIGDNITYIGESLEKIYKSYLHYDALKCKCENISSLRSEVDVINKFNKKINLGALANDIFNAIKETYDGVNQVCQISRSMREFTHPGSDTPELADINKVVQSALTICRSRSKHIATVDTDFMPNPPKILCRPSQIQQVVVNIVVNAVEAIEEQGIQDGRIFVKTSLFKQCFRIEIGNNGPRINEKLREKIFNPFFTTKRIGQGTGQGLALAKDIIVSQHGGFLRLVETPEFPTTFLIDLPQETSVVTSPGGMVSHA
ncbi:MAG: ATP-binding protein [Alphaproteobacteria bacterium]